MKEIWKDVIGYERLYKISNFGRVLSLHKKTNGKILKVNIKKSGYVEIKLSSRCKIKNFSIHRLVACAFIPNLENKLEVNHKDGNKQNNNVKNLEWVNRSENQKHAFKIGLNKYKAPTLGITGYLNKRSKTVVQMDLSRNVINEFGSTHDAERATGVNSCNISMCANNKRISSGGYKWMYKENS